MSGESRVESSLSGPDARVLIIEASSLSSGPQMGVVFEPQTPPTTAADAATTPPCCCDDDDDGGCCRRSFGGRASVNNRRDRSISVVALLERRRWQELAMWPLQADWRTPIDRSNVLL